MTSSTLNDFQYSEKSSDDVSLRLQIGAGIRIASNWGKGSLTVQTYPEGCSGALYTQCHNVRVIGNRFFRLFG